MDIATIFSEYIENNIQRKLVLFERRMVFIQDMPVIFCSKYAGFINLFLKEGGYLWKILTLHR